MILINAQTQRTKDKAQKRKGYFERRLRRSYTTCTQITCQNTRASYSFVRHCISLLGTRLCAPVSCVCGCRVSARTEVSPSGGHVALRPDHRQAQTSGRSTARACALPQWTVRSLDHGAQPQASHTGLPHRSRYRVSLSIGSWSCLHL